MSRFIKDLDESFSDSKKRSLFGLRLMALLATLASAGAAAAAIVSLKGDPIAPFAGAGAVLAFGVISYILLWIAERRMRREQKRMQHLWMARRAEIQELTGRDELTQLQNRRFFYEQMEMEMELTDRYKRELSILMLDVDDLKLINDEFGHQVGDVVLRNFGRVLNQAAGERNVTARIGGDEFAVIMPNADRKDADKLAWKIWEALSKDPICETDHASIFLGVSIGTGGYPWGGSNLEEIIHWADTKLYANKLERKGFKHDRSKKDDDKRLVSAVVDVLSSALDVRDKMTHRHARRVARMSAFVARELKMTEDQVLQIEYAAALHDIGKIGVADNILRKAEPLARSHSMPRLSGSHRRTLSHRESIGQLEQVVSREGSSTLPPPRGGEETSVYKNELVRQQQCVNELLPRGGRWPSTEVFGGKSLFRRRGFAREENASDLLHARQCLGLASHIRALCHQIGGRRGEGTVHQK